MLKFDQCVTTSVEATSAADTLKTYTKLFVDVNNTLRVMSCLEPQCNCGDVKNLVEKLVPDECVPGLATGHSMLLKPGEEDGCITYGADNALARWHTRTPTVGNTKFVINRTADDMDAGYKDIESR